MSASQSPDAEILFEVSWEVCNKVGGIHTVIRSKLRHVQALYSKYVLIGPLFQTPSSEFIPRDPPAQWRTVIEALAAKGVRTAYGVWSNPSEPTVLLVDGSALQAQRNDLKYRYWQEYGVDSLHASWEFEEPMFFATAAGMLIQEYLSSQPLKAIVQCHEWMAGFALLHLHSAKVKVGTVFTTHATMLGRSIMGNGYPLYEMLHELDVSHWAYKLNVQDKHLAEVASAKIANVFTTVSEITGMEAEKILGRAPDVLLYNGFYIEKFPTFEETSIMHYQSKERLKQLVAYTFFPYYSFDIDSVLFFFTSGRYEFGNKGMDVLIEALGRLNDQLRREDSKINVVMFFWVIMGRQAVRTTLLENKNFFQHVQSSVKLQSKPLLQRVVFDIVSGHPPGKDDDTTQFIKDLYADISPLRRQGIPPIVTHEIENEDRDPVIASCRAHGLLNRKEDKVKILLYPGYLDGSDGLLNLGYYDATVGANLGIFPSHYEPWGYTPMESAVLSVPAVTTDLAGFGRYVQSLQKNHADGIFIVKREGKSHEEVVHQLTEHLYKFAHLDHRERVHQGYAAKQLVRAADWTNFIPLYIKAHNLAIAKAEL